MLPAIAIAAETFSVGTGWADVQTYCLLVGVAISVIFACVAIRKNMTLADLLVLCIVAFFSVTFSLIAGNAIAENQQRAELKQEILDSGYDKVIISTENRKDKIVLGIQNGQAYSGKVVAKDNEMTVTLEPEGQPE